MDTQPQQPQDNQVMQKSAELSQLLRQKRQADGRTLEALADSFKVSTKHLAAFESDGFDLSQLDSFQRGYLRNYAALFEIDLAEYETFFPDGKLVSSELKSVDSARAHTAPLISTKSLKWMLVIFILLVAALLISINL